MKKTSYFWVGFSDLMTSLFFIMLVLFAIAFVKLKSSANNEDKIESLEKELAKLRDANKEYAINQAKFDEIKKVEEALSNLDQRYYSFDQRNKRYKLKMDIVFKPNKSDITNLSQHELDQLKKAGNELYNKVSALVSNDSEIEYLLVIEGNTERYNKNHETDPDRGYKLSYDRALALFNFWKDNGIDFNNLNGQCEVIIAGSGYFGQSRNTKDEGYNRRFTIQVTSKVGKFLQNK